MPKKAVKQDPLGHIKDPKVKILIQRLREKAIQQKKEVCGTREDPQP